MDLNYVLKSPTEDPDWVKKCAMAGLPAITIIGGLLTMGWAIRYFEGRRRGVVTLPEPFEDPGGDVVRGLKLVVAVLPLALANILVSVVIGVVAGILARALGGLATLITMPISLAVSVAVIAAQPAFIYRHLITGDLFVAPDAAQVAMGARGGLGAYAFLVLLCMLTGLISGLGAILCWVGIAISLPVGLVMQMTALDVFGRENGV